MENALWDGKLVLASEIGKVYAVEKNIRYASGRKELRCPDPECQNPILRYCHGEIKDAFFAHLNNESCDYAIFDKENTQIMRNVRRVIYESFKKKGYNVRPEVKIISHHYTHLLAEMSDGNRVAVEIGTNHLSANRIDILTEEYQKEGINVKWIVLGNINTTVRENQTFFLKRYLLNESRNRDLLVINWDCSEVAQYKVDQNEYMYNGICLTLENYTESYVEFSTLDSLIFDDNNELSFAGYHYRYQKWLKKKQEVVKKKIMHLEEESRKRMEVINRQAEENVRFHREKQEQSSQWKLQFSSMSSLEKISAETNIIDEKYRQEIIPNMSQQDTQVRDSRGKRWIKCDICGNIDTDDKFGLYGGPNRFNLGVCYNCSRKK